MRAIINEKEERRIARGHLWVYRSEISKSPEAQDGDVIDIMGPRGRFIARACYQSEGAIAARVLSRHQETIDGDFIASRLETARLLREKLFPGSTTYRWVHGESDGLPGFVLDRYGAVASARTPNAFYTKYAAAIVNAIAETEGVDQVRFDCCGQIHEAGGNPSVITVDAAGLELECSLIMGQKTGFYLDQRENAKWIEPIAPGARVLDAHCYVGQWAIRAAKAGAASVHAIDSSEPALEFAARNAERHGVANKCDFYSGDAAAFIAEPDAGPYDIVCIDPPPLAKTRRSLAKSLTVYQSLNRDAMRIINPEGGYLITSTCSHLVDAPAFEEMLKRAARSAKRQAAILRWAGPPADHPQLLSMPETRYLNTVLLRVWTP